MAFLYKDLKASSDYHLRYWKGSVDEYYVKLAKSTTIYVGNLSFYTTEEQIWELFSKVRIDSTGNACFVISGWTCAP
jgi:hypothetical protein